ncbi:MAG: chaperone modulator CbpM [Anaerolineae bacterium]
MTSRERRTRQVDIYVAVQRTRLSERLVRECVVRELVQEPLTSADLEQLRRIRRLQELGVNLPGIEIILQMRRRIEMLQAELDLWQGPWAPNWDYWEERWQRLLPREWEGR